MIYWIIFFGLIFSNNCGTSVKIFEKDAVVWHPEQLVTGKLSGFSAEKVLLHQGDSTSSVRTNEGHFSSNITLTDKHNPIWVEAYNKDTVLTSDTLNYTLGYDPAPIIKPTVITGEGNAVLRATVIKNPPRQSLKYLWVSDSLNPANCKIQNRRQSTAIVDIANKPGNYFFNLFVVSNKDTVKFQTKVSRTQNGLESFDLENDVPQWMDKAVVYEITPYSFVKNGTFNDITAKLAEIKELGINTIWLQPVTESSYKGQGYDVVDYLSVNDELGTKKQLHNLVNTAHELGLRVLFDIVLNHTSIKHPYAQDVIKNGAKSHYYTYYQHKMDDKPYSSFYNRNKQGFIHYFWKDLVNLNYKNKEVQRWMLEVCKYWVREFDIDGYRFDAIWGVNARNPSFAKRLRIELKSIKPDLLLLAEDKGSDPEVFQKGFDVAYDWTADTSWVSQWSWSYEYDHEKNLTIFNYPNPDRRGDMLRKAFYRDAENASRLLRFMGNNDMPHFIDDHSLEQTRMVAGLLFSIPGIPVIYNGQEIGQHGHPYSIDAVFRRDSTIRSQDQKHLFDYYQKLIHLRKKYPALTSENMEMVSASPDDALVALHRWKEDQHFLILINMSDTNTETRIDIPDNVFHESASTYYLRDIVTNDTVDVKQNQSHLKIELEGYSTQLLVLRSLSAN